MLSNKVTCKVIRNKDNMILVEWQEDGRPFRSWISRDMIEEESGDELIVNNPKSGIPYGMDFSKMIEMKSTPEDLDRELKRIGIWTVQDLRARPNEALTAIKRVHGVGLAELLTAASNYQKQVEV